MAAKMVRVRSVDGGGDFQAYALLREWQNPPAEGVWLFSRRYSRKPFARRDRAQLEAVDVPIQPAIGGTTKEEHQVPDMSSVIFTNPKGERWVAVLPEHVQKAFRAPRPPKPGFYAGLTVPAFKVGEDGGRTSEMRSVPFEGVRVRAGF